MSIRQNSHMSYQYSHTIEEVVVMFLLIGGYNVRIKVVANRFQHSIKTITRHFKEVRWALCWLGKILIRHRNMANEVHSYVINNPKYFLWFKVRIYKKIFINMNVVYIRSFNIRNFHNHCFISLIITNIFFCCRTVSVQLMEPILAHGSQLIDKLVLGVEKQL